MIIEYARYTIPLAETKAFLSAFDRAQAALAESDQCLAWEMARGVEDQTDWVIRIEWLSLDGHQQEFRSSPHYTAYMKPLRRFGEFQRESRHFKANEVTGRK